MMSDEPVVVGPLFTDALYEKSSISSRLFSLAMQGYSNDVPSTIDFGKPVASRVIGSVIDQNTSVTFMFNEDYYWSTSLQAISFGPGPD